MALQPTPLSPPPVHSSNPTPTTPFEISQQLQRVEMLHQQLKAEAQRAQEFLMKLRRGELEAQTQAQLQLEQRQREKEEAERRGPKSDGEEQAVCRCNCPHHAPPASASGQTHLQNHNNHNSFATTKDLPMPPLSLPTRVDEREVRDLEKRVRGLEGRVRGFEGLPPDREMALLEVERLRRELEGLARRREGLFEGLGGEAGLSFGTNGGGGAANGKVGKAVVNGNMNGAKATAGAQKVVGGSGKAVAHGKGIGKGARKG
ncbi:MAG: hypothetical protein Q9217_000278 [Psora testacea]